MHASWSASDGSDWVNYPSLCLDIADEYIPIFSPSKLCSSTPLKAYEQVTPHLPPSPKPPKKLKFDPSSAVVHENEGWQLSKVMELRGCSASCAREVHRLSEYDVLMAHSSFQSKCLNQQCEWIHEYFSSHCPNLADGAKDLKNITYIICGKTVCKTMWQASLSLPDYTVYVKYLVMVNHL